MLGIGLVFATTTLAARHLGPAEYGMFNSSLSIAVLLATLAPIGSDRLAARNLSIITGIADQGREIGLAHLITGISAAAVVLAATGLLLLFRRSSEHTEWSTLVVLSTILFLPMVLTYLRQWIAIPVVGARSATMPEQTILPLGFLAVISLAMLLDRKLNATLATVIYAAIAMTVWAASILNESFRQLFRAALRSRVRASDVTTRLGAGAPFVGVSLGGVLLNRMMPLVIAGVTGFDDSAQFAVALQFAALPGIPLGVANLCMIPRCSRHFEFGEHREAEQVIRATTTVTFAVSLTIAVAAWMLSPVFLILLGSSYEKVPMVLPTLLSVAVLEAATGPLVAILQAARMEVIYSKVTLLFIPIQLGLIAWFGHAAGIMGAAVAYLVSRSLWNLMLMLIIRRQSGILSVPFVRISQIRKLIPVP